jgi:hypothetical protein
MQLVLPATSVWGKEENGKWPFRPYVQMLASNNISAGRVVTRMQFDTKATAPKLLFSPVAAVNADDVESILAQGKSSIAEMVVKLTVYQADEGNSNAAASDDEPKLRETGKKPEAAPTADVSDVVKKWSKK